MKARDIMSSNVITVNKETSIEEIAHILTENNISGVPVVDEGYRVVGMVTQKDLLYKDISPKKPAMMEILGAIIYLKGAHEYNEELRKIAASKAGDIMTKNVYTVQPDTEVERVAELMVERDVNRIPVVEGGKLIGIISRADIVRYIAKKME